jgi:DNA replication protein DnaC
MVSPEVRKVFRDLVTGVAPWPLYLFGPAGTGKTSAALVLLDHCGPIHREDLEHDTPARLRNWLAGYADVRALVGLKLDCDKQRLHWANGAPASWDRLLAAAARFGLFVLDEIAVGGEQGDFRLDTLLEVVDQRAGDPVRPFVMTGNAKPAELAKLYDDRVADRVLAGTVLKVDGVSRRTGR